MLDRDTHVPLYIQLKNEIAEKIKNGEWEIDSKIPTEKDLMEYYKVGRATVREAVSLLVNQGFLYKRQGIGTFVNRKRPSYGFEPLVSLAFSLKARGISQKNIISESKTLIPNKNLILSMKWKSKAPCFYMKRIRFAEELPIAIEHSYFPDAYKNLLKEYDLTGSIAKIIIEDLKLSIVKVTQVIELKSPSKEEMEELNLSENINVLNMERWIYIDGNEEPFYYLKFIVPENICSFPVENL